MNPIHQLIATHCTYATSALERRTGKDGDRVLGYSVRTSSLERDVLKDWFRKIERNLSYYLPRDTPADAKRQLTAASAPKRLVYVPVVEDLEMLAQICYRPTDTAGRTGSYFAHCLVRRKNDPGHHWSILDCVKLWAAAQWLEEDTASLPTRLASLSGLEDMLDGRRPAIDERVVLSFLTAPTAGPFDDPGGVIPARWRQKPPDERRDLFATLLAGFLDPNGSPSKALLVVAEPGLAALVFFGILRLVPSLASDKELAFSTFEADVDRRRFTLTATCFQSPDRTDLPPQMYQSGAAQAVVNTFRNTRSPTSAAGTAAAQALLDTLVRHGYDTLDRTNRTGAGKMQTKTVDPYYEWLGIPPKDQPPNHYRLLGLELFEENRNVIDAAANRQMSFIKEYQAGADSALSQKLLNQLSAARICLLSPATKAAYDEQLRAKRQAQMAPDPAEAASANSRWRHESAAPPRAPRWACFRRTAGDRDGVHGGSGGGREAWAREPRTAAACGKRRIVRHSASIQDRAWRVGRGCGGVGRGPRHCFGLRRGAVAGTGTAVSRRRRRARIGTAACGH
jgi:hypothetical protein